MNGKMTMQVNQDIAVQAFQLWADLYLKTPVTVLSVVEKSVDYGPHTVGPNVFEISIEPTRKRRVDRRGSNPVARVGDQITYCNCDICGHPVEPTVCRNCFDAAQCGHL
jgi:hypothetical protein